MYENQTVIITGGSSGLGKALAERFLQQKAQVVIIARNKEKLERAKNELAELGKTNLKPHAFACDVTDYQAAKNLFDEIVDTLGAPDILIGNAGIIKEGYFDQLPIHAFSEVMAVNYFGVLNCAKAITPHFIQAGGGRIVNICSMAGKMGSFGYSAYCSSKFAVMGLTETLRIELKPHNVKVQIACPGEFDSPMVEELNRYRTNENKMVTQTVPVLSLEAVADAVMKGIARGDYLTIPGAFTRAIDLANRIFPSLTHKITDHQVRKAIHA